MAPTWRGQLLSWPTHGRRLGAKPRRVEPHLDAKRLFARVLLCKHGPRRVRVRVRVTQALCALNGHR